jgi:Regulator of chromosome condensation (RCC1) repeat
MRKILFSVLMCLLVVDGAKSADMTEIYNYPLSFPLNRPKKVGTVVALSIGGAGDNQAVIPSYIANIVAVSAGVNHNLALTYDGRVLAWGKNDRGQCDVPSDLADVVQISAGRDHSMALLSNGRIRVWGWNGMNQISSSGLNPNSLTNIISILAGDCYSMALDNNGLLRVWGAISKTVSGVTAMSAGSTKIAVRNASGDITIHYGYISDYYTPLPRATSVTSFALFGVSSLLLLNNDETTSPSNAINNAFLAVSRFGSLTGSVSKSGELARLFNLSSWDYTALPSFNDLFAVSVGEYHALGLQSLRTPPALSITTADNITDVSYYGQNGYMYSLQMSSNLVDWTNYTTDIYGADSINSLKFPINNDKMFFRILRK